jgi:hypothetical protein
MTKDDALEMAIKTLELVLTTHGVVLLSDPPQDAWKAKRVSSRITEAITAAKHALEYQEETK